MRSIAQLGCHAQAFTLLVALLIRTSATLRTVPGALVRALCNVIDAKNALASKPAQIDHRLHGPADSRLETTNHRSERLHRGGQMPHLAGNKAKLCILELSVSPTILTGTAPFVPLLISIGPEHYYLAARTWRCQELHSFRG
jgi:hypothetical protein